MKNLGVGKEKNFTEIFLMPLKCLQNIPTFFNGLDILISYEGLYSTNREDKFDQFIVHTTEKAFKSQRALALYIVVWATRQMNVQLSSSPHQGVGSCQFNSTNQWRKP